MKLSRRRLVKLTAGGLLTGWVGVAAGRRFMSANRLFNNQRAPAFFVGHGSPMNAIETNDFTRALEKMGQVEPKPKAILVVSAHWLSSGTWVTHMPQPKMIYDMYGFPEELYQIQYPAPGSPETAEVVQKLISKPKIHLDDKAWGFDHGTWSVLRHMYPKADVPVIQLSIDMSEPPPVHYYLGQQLSALRDQGVMILGSGNIVHNLRRMNFESDKPFDWNLEFDQWVKANIVSGDHDTLIRDFNKSEAGKLSVPTPDHFYPLLYVLGASMPNEELNFDFEGYSLGSISMRCLSFKRV